MSGKRHAEPRHWRYLWRPAVEEECAVGRPAHNTEGMDGTTASGALALQFGGSTSRLEKRHLRGGDFSILFRRDVSERRGDRNGRDHLSKL